VWGLESYYSEVEEEVKENELERKIRKKEGGL